MRIWQRPGSGWTFAGLHSNTGRLQVPVGSIAVRRITGPFTAAPGYFAGLFTDHHFWTHPGTFSGMGAVAEWLLAGKAAGAPCFLVSFILFQNKRFFLWYSGFK